MERISVLTILVLMSCHKTSPSNSTPISQSARVRPSSLQDQELFLIQDWDNSKTSNTHFIGYRLVNRGTSPIYPTRDNFFGTIEEWDGEQWGRVAGGASCVSAMTWIPLEPGMMKRSVPYLAHPMILRIGRYRYRVEYSFDSFESVDRAIRSVIAEFEIK